MFELGVGSLVTGTFKTRAVSELVRLKLEGGFEFVGTPNHPICLPASKSWVGLSELVPGQKLQARAGLVEIQSLEKLYEKQPVYNIEIDLEHVYEITPRGIIVHNSDGFDCDRYHELKTKKDSKQQLSPDEQADLDRLETQVKDNPNLTSTHPTAPEQPTPETPGTSGKEAPNRTKIGKFLEGDDVAEAGLHAKEVGKVTGVVDRAGADARRAERMKGRPTIPGKDRDEFPPAAIKPDDPSKVSVKPIDPSQNRRSGRRLRDELPPDGTPVEIDP